MTSEVRKRLQSLAVRIQRFGVGLSAVLGGLVGLAFASGSIYAWSFAFGSFICLLWIGMAVVVISAISERIAAGDWRAGMRLSSQVFLAQTTNYGLAVLVFALMPGAATSVPIAQLALAMLPGLYLCSIIAIVGSGPLYLSWLPLRHDR
jgi:hypothetical protein